MESNIHSSTDTITVEDVAAVAFQIAQEIWGKDEVQRRFGEIGEQPDSPARPPGKIPLTKPPQKESA